MDMDLNDYPDWMFEADCKFVAEHQDDIIEALEEVTA